MFNLNDLMELFDMPDGENNRKRKDGEQPKSDASPRRDDWHPDRAREDDDDDDDEDGGYGVRGKRRGQRERENPLDELFD